MMHRGIRACGLLLALALLFSAQPAVALIPAAFPLKAALKSEQHIVVAKVDKLLPDKPAMMLVVDEVLKGKPPFEKLPVNLTPDAEGKKAEDDARLLKRVAEGEQIVIFASKRGKKWTGFCFTNGSWFQMAGTEEGDPPAVRWSFLHFEPVLRQTFKGTTAEMRQTISDALAGKKEPPEVDLKEKPGIGPELKKEEKKGSLPVQGGPMFAVIPTVAIGGPLAILSMLFPSLFGKPKEVLQRYLALLTVVTITSTVYLLHVWQYQAIREYWWGKPSVLWTFMGATTILGAVWAWQRHRKALRNGVTADALLPKRGEEIVFVLLSLSGLVFASYAFGRGELLDSPWREFLMMWAVVWAGTLTALYLRRRQSQRPEGKPRLPMEGVMLLALGVTCGVIGYSLLPRAAAAAPDPVQLTAGDDLPPERDLKREFSGVVWTFQPEEAGRLDSTPLVAGDRVYAGVAHRIGFTTFGRLYCLDVATGEKKWAFDDEGEMKQIYCSPSLADGKVYIGEGYHQDSNCKVYCLDAADGKKLWEFKTKSHTESRPFVGEGKVYFGAGDDGIYCLDAATGKELWHFEGLHVDTNLTVVGNRLYGGSAYGEQYWMFCLDTANGKPHWREPSKYPVFGSPTVYGKRVFYGTGNGDMLNSDKKPGGAALCLNTDNGKTVWRFDDVKDGVLTRPMVDRQYVWFGSRDGNVYCVNRTTGKLSWKIDLGSPVVAASALGYCSCCGDTNAVYVAASSGRVVSVNPDSGASLWPPFDLGVHAAKPAQLIATPRLWSGLETQGEHHRLLVGASVGPKDDTMPVLYCIEDRYTWPAHRGGGERR